MKFSKERNFNKMKNKKIGAEEITLAPTTEIYNEAHKIALETTTEEKFPFVLDYDANEKETLLSMLNEVGAEIEKDSATHASISVRMNMTQLKLVKGLDCVIRVRTHRYNDRSLIKGEKKLISEDFTNIDVESDITNSDENSGDIAVMSLRSSPSSGVTEENFDGGGEVGESNLHLSDSEMASAKEINIGDSVDGCICCPGAEKYFKFKVIDQGIYTIYTTSDLDTVGHLYDSNGDLIVSVDDHEPGGEINFRIVRTLAANSTYYIKVHLRNNDTGEYTLRITDDILPNSVTITPGTITLKHGVTYELPITPNYTYKGYNGAQRIPGLSVSISPSNANEQKIWWWEQDGDVLKCSYGWDDDGDRHIHVTATGIGTAKLYAQDWNENGKKAECAIVVRSWPEYSKPFIHSRDEWGAKEAIASRLKARERNPERIIFHHPANPFSSTNIDDIKAEIKRIQNIHISALDGDPKSDIAYHFLIDPAGGIWQGAEIDEYKRGHAEGYFDDIGVSILGNFEPEKENDYSADILNDYQKNAMKELSKWLCFKYNLKSDTSDGISPITTHRTVCDTDCPGENAAPWIESELKNHIANWYFE